jgi:hypothetical protein
VSAANPSGEERRRYGTEECASPAFNNATILEETSAFLARFVEYLNSDAKL